MESGERLSCGQETACCNLFRYKTYKVIMTSQFYPILGPIQNLAPKNFPYVFLFSEFHLFPIFSKEFAMFFSLLICLFSMIFQDFPMFSLVFPCFPKMFPCWLSVFPCFSKIFPCFPMVLTCLRPVSNSFGMSVEKTVRTTPSRWICGSPWPRRATTGPRRSQLGKTWFYGNIIPVAISTLELVNLCIV